jgi:hypothetical protein
MDVNEINNIQGYKKIDVEKYQLIESRYDGKKEFNRFPCDGLWIVQTKKNSKSTSLFLEKYDDLPELYPLISLSLRKDEISSAIMRFVDKKNKSLLDLGQCSYTVNEFAEFIIKYVIASEIKGGNKKVLIEKKWVNVNPGDDDYNRLLF